MHKRLVKKFHQDISIPRKWDHFRRSERKLANNSICNVPSSIRSGNDSIMTSDSQKSCPEIYRVIVRELVVDRVVDPWFAGGHRLTPRTDKNEVMKRIYQKLRVFHLYFLIAFVPVFIQHSSWSHLNIHYYSFIVINYFFFNSLSISLLSLSP